MIDSEKIKIINNKIQQNKAQNNLETKTAKMSVLPWGSIGKYGVLTGEDILLEKELLYYRKKLLQSKDLNIFR